VAGSGSFIAKEPRKIIRQGFPFDMAHSTISGDGDGEPEVETTCTGTEREAEEACVFGSGSASGGR
jgi:hypothetical protein